MHLYKYLDKNRSYIKGLDLVDLMCCPNPVMHRLRLFNLVKNRCDSGFLCHDAY